ncbi:MAG: ATP-binding protein [Akkermansiaceae bacterium]|nr:ATP-binding protein [Akkermansiaceae bacterium]
MIHLVRKAFVLAVMQLGKSVKATKVIPTLLLALGMIPATAFSEMVEFQEFSLGELENRLQSIDRELDQLASNSFHYQIGTIGFRSAHHSDPHHPEWFQVDLDREQTVDEVILVPTLWRHTKTGLQSDGFPQEFRVVVGEEGHSEGEVVARFSKEDQFLPRIAPLVIPCNGIAASWIRVEATTLSPRAWDGQYIFQLSEILVFSGEDNVALRQAVQVSSNDGHKGRARYKETLVDGFTPYLMDAAQGDQSIAFFSELERGAEVNLTIDLGSVERVDRIHLHSLELGDTVPQVSPPGMGIPRHLVVLGARSADFSDASPLCEFVVETTFDTGAIMMRRFPPAGCRFLRLKVVEPFTSDWDGSSNTQIGFAEIEIYAGGRNVAAGKEFQADFEVHQSGRSISALTDSLNLYGDILSIHDWMGQLARRHDLETERPLVLAELDQRYENQKKILNRLSWVTAFLAAGIAIVILINRIWRLRQVARIKERFAADLHDEVGANLHAIALLSDVAKDKVGSDEDLAEIIDEVRTISLETSDATRNCTSMLEAEGLCEDLAGELRRTAKRLMVDLDHEIEITGEEFLQGLRPKQRIDLLLFYKESLVNIIRHSQATRVRTSVTADSKTIALIVSDNGIGLRGELPRSLRRRARLVGGKVRVEKDDAGGARITLRVGPRSK